MIGEAYKANFDTMLRAAANNDLALMECKDKKTGESVKVVCMVSRDGEDYIFMPVAKLFDGDPFEELEPPRP